MLLHGPLLRETAAGQSCRRFDLWTFPGPRAITGFPGEHLPGRQARKLSHQAVWRTGPRLASVPTGPRTISQDTVS